MSGRPASLTARQAETLRLIGDSIAKRGYPPTVRELAKWLGGISTNAVNNKIVSLERNGFLKRGPPRTPRSLRIISPAEHDEPRARLLQIASSAPLALVRELVEIAERKEHVT